MIPFEKLVADALDHHKSGRLADAEAAYAQALSHAPGHPAVLHNLGVVTAARGDHAGALAIFEQVVAAEPGYASAHYNQGVALEALGRPKHAIEAFRHTVRLDPGHYDAHRALGFLWLAVSDRGRSLDHFARTYELRRGEDRTGLAARSLDHASREKLAHDAAQFRYLATDRRHGQRFEILARIYDDVARALPAGIVRLSGPQLENLGDDYNCAIHVAAAPEIAGPVVDPALDVDRLVQAVHRSGAVGIDALLTRPALEGLRRTLLESTIWHDFGHIGGFVATYLEDGLASPLVLQIADAIRSAFGELLAPHPLTQAWAFKGLAGLSAVESHADDAAYSVNLWLTPDAANLEPGRGGLTVCLEPPPPDWLIAGYDADKAEIAAFLDRHADNALAVPYGENRAVLFRSRLFHRSDAPRFAAGYANHRINLTLLYGRSVE